MTRNLVQVTPCLHVDDLDEAVGFFTTGLGFTVAANENGYAYLSREGVAFRLFQRDSPRLEAPERLYAHYVDVVDLGALLDELKPWLAGLPADSVEGPVDQPWGQRELMLDAPDGSMIVFGQGISTPPPT